MNQTSTPKSPLSVQFWPIFEKKFCLNRASYFHFHLEHFIFFSKARWVVIANKAYNIDYQDLNINLQPVAYTSNSSHMYWSLPWLDVFRSANNCRPGNFNCITKWHLKHCWSRLSGKATQKVNLIYFMRRLSPLNFLPVGIRANAQFTSCYKVQVNSSFLFVSSPT